MLLFHFTRQFEAECLFVQAKKFFAKCCLCDLQTMFMLSIKVSLRKDSISTATSQVTTHKDQVTLKKQKQPKLDYKKLPS